MKKQIKLSSVVSWLIPTGISVKGGYTYPQLPVAKHFNHNKVQHEIFLQKEN